MDLSELIIKTKNLSLEPISHEFEQEIFTEFTPEITLYMFPKSPDKIEETQEFIATSLRGLKEGTDLQMVILEKGTRDFLGCCGLHKINTKTPELGVWLKKSAHGNRWGQEAMNAVKAWADKNLRFDYILYPVAEPNAGSRKVAESLGGEIAREYDEKTQGGKTWKYLEYRIYPPQKLQRSNLQYPQDLAII
jgi:RimJ/RimL family protein N-acetyltransferase